jgi:hypothetical protein
LLPLFATGVIDTGGKFVAGVVDTGGNFPPVLLIPMVHLHLQISLRIFEKFVMNQMLFSGAWGKMIHEKNLKQKNPSHCSFNAINSHLPAL